MPIKFKPFYKARGSPNIVVSAQICQDALLRSNAYLSGDAICFDKQAHYWRMFYDDEDSWLLPTTFLLLRSLGGSRKPVHRFSCRAKCKAECGLYRTPQ